MAVNVAIAGGTFEVTLTGFDAVWALRRHLVVALGDLTGASVVPRAEAIRQLRWRIGGTYWPGSVCAGHYTLRSRQGRAFASVYRDPEVLEVRTRLRRPHVILLQHPDREALASALAIEIHGGDERG